MVEKSQALYFHPESIGFDAGASCDICWKFNRKENLCAEVEGEIDPKGVCGLYVHGEPFAEKLKASIRQVTKSEAGYISSGPTHCANCDEMIVPRLYGESRCKKVEGMIEGRGCCSLWEAK